MPRKSSALLGEKEKSVHLTSWPEKFDIKENKEDSDKWAVFIEILTNIRMAKSKAQKSIKAEVILSLEKDKQDKIKDLLEDLKKVMSIREIQSGNFDVRFI